MSFACGLSQTDAGAMRALLSTVDCTVRKTTESGFLALTGPGSFFPEALTALLVIYVAVIGYRLMLGRGGLQLADVPIVALKIGAILALTLQWPLFQTAVVNLAYEMPAEVASGLSSSGAANSDLWSRAQAAHDQMLLDSAALGKLAALKIGGANGPEGRASDSLAKAAQTFFLATAGALAIALIAIGILTMIGPILIALYLFVGTRGLFVGWVRALCAAAIGSLIVWLTSALMLSVLEPELANLAFQRSSQGPDPASSELVAVTVTVFSLAESVLILAGAIVAIGFSLHHNRSQRTPGPATGSAHVPASRAPEGSRLARLSDSLARPSPLRDQQFAGPPRYGVLGRNRVERLGSPAGLENRSNPEDGRRLGEAQARRTPFRPRRPGLSGNEG